MTGVIHESPERFLSLTIADAELSTVDKAIQDVLFRIAKNRFRRLIAPFSRTKIYEIDPPAGGGHLFKLALYSPRQFPTGSVFITNVADGWNSLSQLVAREHGQFQLQVISSRSHAQYPQNRMEVWRDGRSVRVIMAMRDTAEWIFYQEGETEDFEEIDVYRRRMKKDRLNRDVIFRYLHKLGWNVEDSSFWDAINQAIYFEELRKE